MFVYKLWKSVVSWMCLQGVISWSRLNFVISYCLVKKIVLCMLFYYINLVKYKNYLLTKQIIQSLHFVFYNIYFRLSSTSKILKKLILKIIHFFQYLDCIFFSDKKPLKNPVYHFLKSLIFISFSKSMFNILIIFISRLWLSLYTMSFMFPQKQKQNSL